MPGPNHQTLKRLLALWETEVAEEGRGGLGRLSSRDLGYFSEVFKDSFVARGAAEGPFRLSFVGTSLEAHIGRKMVNVVVADCFDRQSSMRLGAHLREAVRRSRPLRARLVVSSAHRAERMHGELLCLPFADPGSGDPVADTATIFGTVAIAGLDQLPPEPTHRELAILAMELL